MPLTKSRHLFVFGFIALAAVALAQTVNTLILSRLAVGETLVVNPLLWLTHVRNTGGIFGSFQGGGWFFAFFTLCILTGVVIYLVRAQGMKLFNYICLGLITGGGLSNILDRLLFGAVIDYFNVQQIPFWKYIFNTADVMIHLGLWPLLLLTWLGMKTPPNEGPK